MEPAPVQRRSVHATGFIVLDLLLADGRMTPIVGGTAANVAVNLSLLGWDSSVTALLGDDRAGKEVVRQLNEYGVDTTGVVLDPAARTPVLIHEVVRGRHRFRFSCPQCGSKYAKFRPLEPGKVSEAPEASVHFFDRASSYATRLAEAVNGSAVAVFEPGTPGRPAATAALASSSHVLRVSSELEIEPGTEAVSPQVQVVGLGSDGVRFRLAGDPEWVHLPSELRAPLVDAGGAGDWLTSGILDAVPLDKIHDSSLRPDELRAAVLRGLALAAVCCQYEGTRGQVGSSAWTDATRQLTLPAPTVPRLPTFDTQDCRDCEAWFHQ
jgi:fructokinase